MVFHCSGDSKGQPALQQMEKSVNAWKENEMKWNGKSATIQEYVLSQSKMKVLIVKSLASYTGSNII